MIVSLAFLAAVPVIAGAMREPFYIALATRVMIFAIAAISLDLILGYGRLVSFGHAAYLGVGGYIVGILSYHGVSDGFIHFGVTILISAAVAFLIGAISVRTSGVHFIMITLAFCQMLYYLAVSVNLYGGDDGLTIREHSRFPGLDLGNPLTLYYAVLVVVLLVLLLGDRIIGSHFGMVLRGIRSDERRMIAIGFSTYRYKLAAFVISGVMCGIAGALLANQNLFISPAIMHWSRSGEIMVMVILGGMGSLFGPVLGAMTYLTLEDLLSRMTQHWQIIMGPFLFLVVLLAKGGIFGWLSGSAR
jgi:branched-chain amino acid transport system permease protein